MNKFEYLIFDLCLAYCNLCLSLTIQKEIYLGECGHSFCIPCYNKIFGHKKVETSAFFMDVIPVRTTVSTQEKGVNVHVLNIVKS